MLASNSPILARGGPDQRHMPFVFSTGASDPLETHRGLDNRAAAGATTNAYTA
ncbi:MAG: hypothetical protein KUG77_19690 [Nannocystaceae bacterium]|nr:hypothetical protein [Nannocystaceae bacterium]